MSVSDDVEYIKALLGKTETFIAGEIASVKLEQKEARGQSGNVSARLHELTKENAELGTRISKLENENAELKAEMETLKGELNALKLQPHVTHEADSCTRKLQGAFAAGLDSILASCRDTSHPAMPQSGQHAQRVGDWGSGTFTPMQSSPMQSSPMQSTQMQSTPMQSTPRQSSPIMIGLAPTRIASMSPQFGQEDELTAEIHAPAKRHRRTASATARVYDTIEDLQEPMRSTLRPFHKKDFASKDLLNDVQRAYVKYRAAQVITTGEAITENLIQQVIDDGVNERIWTETYQPGTKTGDFNCYLINRIRSEKKSANRKADIEQQGAHIAKLINDSLNKSGQKGDADDDEAF